MGAKRKHWSGVVPVDCDTCGGELNGVFVDGATTWGGWAIMCERCWRLVGHPLGRAAQAYKWDGEVWAKVEPAREEVDLATGMLRAVQLAAEVRKARKVMRCCRCGGRLTRMQQQPTSGRGAVAYQCTGCGVQKHVGVREVELAQGKAL